MCAAFVAPCSVPEALSDGKGKPNSDQSAGDDNGHDAHTVSQNVLPDKAVGAAAEQKKEAFGAVSQPTMNAHTVSAHTVGESRRMPRRKPPSRGLTGLSLAEAQDESKLGQIRRLLIGDRLFYTPRQVPLDLMFFRRIYTRLYRRYGTGGSEVPTPVFQRTVMRLFYVLNMHETEFDANEYDVDASGAVGWYEFVTCWRTSRISVSLSEAERLFVAFEEPSSCALGQLLSATITLLIFVSCVFFMLGTLPQFMQSECPECEPQQIKFFDVLEGFCVCVFTVEYVIRASISPFCRTELLNLDRVLDIVTEHEDFVIPPRSMRFLNFLVAPMNILDLLVIFPWYIQFFMTFFSSKFTVLRVLRLTRLVRLAKLGKYFEVLQIIGRVFHRSLRAFYVLSFYLALCVCFSSAAMYYVEGGSWDSEAQEYMRTDEDGSKDVSPFKSIPHCFWWCIVTYTTVGYGDVYPVTPLGKVVAVCTMLIGIIVLAMPISVVSLNFGEVWDEYVEETTIQAEADEKDFLSVTTALQNLDCRKNMVVEIFDGAVGDFSCDFLGEVRLYDLPVESSEEVSEHLELPLQPNSMNEPQDVEGTLSFDFTWRPRGENSSRGEFEVTIHRVDGLPRSDWRPSGERDARAVVHCWPKPAAIEDEGSVASQSFNTEVIRGLDPVWDQTFRFDFNWDRTDSRLESATPKSGSKLWHSESSETLGSKAALAASPAKSLVRSPSRLSDLAGARSSPSLIRSPTTGSFGSEARQKDSAMFESLHGIVMAQSDEIKQLKAQLMGMHDAFKLLAAKKLATQDLEKSRSALAPSSRVLSLRETSDREPAAAPEAPQQPLSIIEVPVTPPSDLLIEDSSGPQEMAPQLRSAAVAVDGLPAKLPVASEHFGDVSLGLTLPGIVERKADED